MKTKKQVVKRKTPKNRFPGFTLVDGTAGIISNGVYVKNDSSEVRICFAWGPDLHFKPLEDGDKNVLELQSQT